MNIYCFKSINEDLYLTMLNGDKLDSKVDFFATTEHIAWDVNTHFKLEVYNSSYNNLFHIKTLDGLYLSNNGNYMFLSNNKNTYSIENLKDKSIITDTHTKFSLNVKIINLSKILKEVSLYSVFLPTEDITELDTTKKYLIKYTSSDAVITPGLNSDDKTPITLFGTVEESEKCFGYSYFELEKKVLNKQFNIFFYYIKKPGTDLYMQWYSDEGGDKSITPDKKKSYKLSLGKNKLFSAQGGHPDFIIVKNKDGTYTIKNFYHTMKQLSKTDMILSIDKDKKEQNNAVAKFGEKDTFKLIPYNDKKIKKIEKFTNKNNNNSLFKVLFPILLILVIILSLIFYKLSKAT